MIFTTCDASANSVAAIAKVTLTTCYVQMGRLDEAREAVKQIRNLTNVVVPSATNWRNPDQRELYLSVCVWRLARTHEPDPPPCRDPRCRRGGYSRLMGADAEGTLERLKALRREFFDPKIAASSRPPATACWWNFRASSMRCAARSRCSRRSPGGTRQRQRMTASNCASASISATCSNASMICRRTPNTCSSRLGLKSLSELAGKRLGAGPRAGTSGTYFPRIFALPARSYPKTWSIGR